MKTFVIACVAALAYQAAADALDGMDLDDLLGCKQDTDCEGTHFCLTVREVMDCGTSDQTSTGCWEKAWCLGSGAW